MADDFLANIFNKQPKSLAERFGDAQKALNAGRNQKILAALNQVKLNYAQPQEQAKLSYLQDKAKYEPLLDQANLGRIGATTTHENAMTTLAQFQTKNAYLKQAGIQSDNIIKNAEANDASEKFLNQLKIQRGQIAAQHEKVKASANTALAQVMRGMPTDIKGNYIAHHPEYLTLATRALQNSLGNQAGSMIAPPTSPVNANAPANAPANAQDNAPASTPDNNAPDNAAPDNAQNNAPGNAPDNSAPDNTPPPMITAPAPSPQAAAAPPAQPAVSQAPAVPTSNAPQSSPADEAAQLQNQILVNKKGVSPTTYKKAESAVELDKLYEDPTMIRRVKNASYYVGLEGKARLAHDAVFAPNSQRYNDYLTFHNQMPTTLANVMRYMDGMGVQIKSREELIDNFVKAFKNPIGTPDQALQQWDNLRQTNRAVMKASLSLAQPAFPGTLEKINHINLDKPIAFLSKNSRDETADKMIDIISPDGRQAEVPEKNLKKALLRGYRKA